MKINLFIALLHLSAIAHAQQFTHQDSITFHFANPQVGDNFRIPMVWGCYASVRPDVAKTLDDYVVTALKRYPNLIFRLEMHSDCRDDSAYNRRWTQTRADSMFSYLKAKNIDTLRLTAVGMGEDDLLIKKCSCDKSDYRHICTEAEHQQNRRTVLRVMGIRKY